MEDLKFKFSLKGIVLKTALFGWSLIIITIILFVLFSIPYQKQVLLERMASEANGIVTSMLYTQGSSIMTEEYAEIVENQRGIIDGNNTLVYIVSTKAENGFSIIVEKNKWRTETLGGYWNPAIQKKPDIFYSDLVGDEVFHYTYQFVYSGIEWGWIHVGLSLQSYNEAAANINMRTFILALILSAVGFIVSILFARRFTKPITDLNTVVKKISEGDFSANSEIYSGDELESLSTSINKMNKSLKESRDKLEFRVKERTAELAEINTTLVNEVKERVKAENSLNKYTLRLETLQDIYRHIISAKSVKEIIVNTFNNLHAKTVDFDRGSVVLYNFKDQQINIFEISGSDIALEHSENTMDYRMIKPIEKFREKEIIVVNDISQIENPSIAEKKIFHEGIRSYICFPLSFKDQLIGEINLGSKKVAGFGEDEITVMVEIGSQLSVAISQAKLQEQLQGHAESLQNSLREKVVLLKEIHHRVKNNLQIISSLLYLQGKNILDKATRAIFVDSQNRVKSMALVHEKLYQSEDLSLINFSDYIKNLSHFISNNYKSNNRQIELLFNLDKVYLSVDKAVPLGLMLNELLSNCYKYAFPDHFKSIDNATNKINVILQDSRGIIELQVFDNGIGMSHEFKIENSTSLGLQLVYNLADQIDADLIFSNNSGTGVKIKFVNPAKMV